MERNLSAELAINGAPVELNPFVEQFIAHTALGAVSSLRGAETIQDLELHLERGEVTIRVNGDQLPVTPFPRDIITSTITGMVSALKGVGRVDNVRIHIAAV